MAWFPQADRGFVVPVLRGRSGAAGPTPVPGHGRTIVTVRFGLFGTGYWALHTHGAALADHPRAELVGVWGRDPEKTTALAERFGVRAYHDVDALIADVDAVAVALPPDIQADIAARAAEAGRHLLLDKPLAFTLDQADRIVAAADHNHLASRVLFTNRYHANVSAFLDEAAATGRDGGWDGSRVTMLASVFQPGSPYAGSAWRRQRGGLWDIGPHALSVIMPVLGPVAEVTALDGPHATSYLLLRHASGAVSTMTLSLDTPPAAVGSEVMFYGAAGTAAVPGRDAGPVQACGTAITQLVADMAAGRVEAPCDVRSGREVLTILLAADEALRIGRRVAPATR
jgi:predicted dehydrogenase